jgi:hypothetical protein
MIIRNQRVDESQHPGKKKQQELFSSSTGAERTSSLLWLTMLPTRQKSNACLQRREAEGLIVASKDRRDEVWH